VNKDLFRKENKKRGLKITKRSIYKDFDDGDAGKRSWLKKVKNRKIASKYYDHLNKLVEFIFRIRFIVK